MKVPLGWLAEFIDGALPAPEQVADLLTGVGLAVEAIEPARVSGPLVVARVTGIEELTGFKKPIRFCSVEVGGAFGGERGIVCGARNFAVGDVVVVALPGAVLPGPFPIAARETYGRVSDGMICSARELGLGDDHAGILVLSSGPPAAGSPTAGGLTIGADAAALFGLDDPVLDIAVLPDRGYALSVRGLARELAGVLGLALRDPAALSVGPAGPADPAAAPPPPGTAPGPAVSLPPDVGCDRYLAQEVGGVDLAAPSPPQLVGRLAACGMRSISLPVDVTNYVLLELGQPLHAFDADRVTGALTVRRAAPGERLVTLDGADRQLDAEDLVIADDRGPVALAGVMGGRDTEVTATTRRLIIEAAHFDPLAVARTARRHRLPSEAARRFERDADPALPPAAAARACELLARHGGAVAGPVTDVDHRAPARVVSFDPQLPTRLGGFPVAADDVAAHLAAVGAAVVRAPAGEWEVTPPSWRPDLTGPHELAEEVLRLAGYDHIPAVLPTPPPGRGLTPSQRRRRRVADALADAGLVEVLTAPFVSEAAVAALGHDPATCVRLANPLSDAEALLRPSLLPGLLAAAARNLGRGLGDVALVESGLVFHRRAGDGSDGVAAPRPPVDARPDPGVLAAVAAALPSQPRMLAAVLCGRRVPGWPGPGRDGAAPADWADAVEVAEIAARTLGLRLQRRAATAPGAAWHPGRTASLAVGGTVVGTAGELHPRAAAAAGVPRATVAVELDLDALIAAAAETGPPQAPVVSPFPPATRDVALVVASDVPAEQVAAALRTGAGTLLESVELFDVYTGPPVPEGSRSLAFALRLRAGDRTLTDAEANTARDDAVAAATAATGAVLR